MIFTETENKRQKRDKIKLGSRLIKVKLPTRKGSQIARAHANGIIAETCEYFGK